MKLFLAYHFLIFLSLTLVAVAVPKYAMTGCNDTCGNVRIPYPFGIGANCSVNKWYIVECNSSTPYLSALNHSEVLGVNLEDQIITVNSPKISDCQNRVLNGSQTTSIDLGRSPFLFSKSHNRFVVEGCGNAVMMDHGRALTGCSTNCLGETVSDENNCLGIACCETTIPYHIRSYTINLTRLERQGGDRACRSAFLVDKNSSDEGRSSGSFVPISLLWTLSDHDKHQVTCCSNYKYILKVDVGNGTTMDTWKCSNYEPYEGNSYLSDGCQATEECARCEGNHGYCSYDRIYDVDGLAKEWNFTCIYLIRSFNYRSNWARIITIIGAVIITSGLGIIAIIYTSYKLIKRTITKRRRKSVFKRINGSLLLKQQEEIDPSLVDKTILFTSRELAKATDSFNQNRILGKGGQGTVYKGMLADGRIVAIKKSTLVDESQLEQFINEVVILSQVNHRNVVKLLGCCLETEVPLLVSEFIPNGTLYDPIHDEKHELPLSLNMRLQVATEVAQALAYLHSATSIPIYHRDIKTTNILLDDKYRAKVSDFGTSRCVSTDQTHLTTLVKGTLGYLDPEYFQSSQFTEKSDVYSFGVVMVELLTGEMPISLTRFGENRSLVVHFKLAMEEGRVMSIFDALVIKEGTRNELIVLANIAMQCLNPVGKNRPTMKEVATKLEIIRTSHVPFMVQNNIEQVMHGEEISMLSYGESTSTFLSFNDRISQ